MKNHILFWWAILHLYSVDLIRGTVAVVRPDAALQVKAVETLRS